MKKIIATLLICLTIGTICQAQIRQVSSTEGFRLGLSVGRLGWSSDYFTTLPTDAGSGINFGANVGYGINQLIEPYLGFEYTSIGTSNIGAESFNFTHVDAGLRLNFGGTVNQLRPFIQAGYGLQNASIKSIVFNNGSVGNLSFGGGIAHVGGGLNYFIKENLSLNLKGVFTFGGKGDIKINNQNIGEQADASTFRLSVGVVFSLSSL
jgi:opacity protein-like surface antigen